MESSKAQELIAKMDKDIRNKGFIKEDLVADLKELRTYAIREEDPTLTKVLRLIYEHIEKYGSFNIPIPAEMVEDDEGNELVMEAPENIEDDFDAKRESLLYLLSIFKDNRNKYNRIDLIEYRNQLMHY